MNQDHVRRSDWLAVILWVICCVGSNGAQTAKMEMLSSAEKTSRTPIELQVRVFGMSRAQLETLVAKGEGKLGDAPTVTLKRVLGESPKAWIAQLGMLSPDEVEALWRALEAETSGVDMIFSPKLTIDDGKTGSLRIGKTFRYPTSFAPKKGSRNEVIPGAYESCPLGFRFDATPSLSADAKTIDLKLHWEFASLVEYRRISDQKPIVINDKSDFDLLNCIAQPVISRNRCDTQVFVPSGRAVWFQAARNENKGTATQFTNEFVFLVVQAVCVQ